VRIVNGDIAPDARIVLWLNHARRELTLPSPRPLLFEVLAAHGISYRLHARTWADPALGTEPLLVAAGGLAGPLELVHNGQLATVGVAHLRVQAGDEIVIGEASYLRERFPFFR
jgi:hypothetical protein